MNLNTTSCGGSDVLGAGLLGCAKDRQRVTALGLLKKGYRLDPLVKFDLELITKLQQEGILIVLNGVTTFVDNTPDANINTAAGSGIKRVMGKMPYEFLATFENGYYFSKALNSLDGWGNYDIIFFDVENVAWGTEITDGIFKGYSLGMHMAGNYKGSDGDSVVANNTLAIQLINRNEIDHRMAYVECEDFDVSDVIGINETILNIEPVASAATKVRFTAVLAVDNHTSVNGLTQSDFTLTKNGAALPITALTQVGDTYEATVTAVAATDVLELKMKFLTYDVVVSDVGYLYKAKPATAVVTA